jgi:predicted ester cyclase
LDPPSAGDIGFGSRRITAPLKSPEELHIMPADSMPEVEATVRRFYEALNTGDTTLVDQALAPGWEAIPALRTGPGPEGWKASIAHLRSVFTDLTVTIEDVVVSGDRAAVRSVNRAIHSGELLGVPGTGNQVEFRAADIHRLEGGRIVQTWHLEDYFGIATQIGLTFTPAS